MIHVVTKQDSREYRSALIAWATANGLDADRIAEDGLTIEQVGDRQVIAYSEYQVDAHGRTLVDLTGPNRYQTVHRTRTLRHALPEGIGRPLCTCTLNQLDPACSDHQAATQRDETPGG